MLLAAFDLSRAEKQGSAASQAALGIAKLHGLLIDKTHLETTLRKPAAAPDAADEMTEAEWNDPELRRLGILLSGELSDERDAQGKPVCDETFLLLLNAHHEAVDWVLPTTKGADWQLIMDTIDENGFVEKRPRFEMGSRLAVQPRSLCLLMLCLKPGRQVKKVVQAIKEKVHRA
jgi:pullulanase/glycogen debranching enzyme